MLPLNHERDIKVNTKVIDLNNLIDVVTTIAQRLKLAREKMGLTQVQLAEKVKVSQATIGNIEIGLRKKPREIISLSRVLNVNPTWLETGKGMMNIDEPSPRASEQLPPSWRTVPDDLIQALGIIQFALARLDLQGRERIAPLFESFAKSPGQAMMTDIAELLEGQGSGKSRGTKKAEIQKTG